MRGGSAAGYPLYTRFAWGQNLKQGQPVLLAGVNVGYVSDVKLRRDGFLDVDLRVDNDVQVPKGSMATVKPVGIFGDVAVALTPNVPVPRWTTQPGDTVPAGPPRTDIGADHEPRRLDRDDRAAHDAGARTQSWSQAGGVARTCARRSRRRASLVGAAQSIAAEQNRNLTVTMNRASAARLSRGRLGEDRLDAAELPADEREPRRARGRTSTRRAAARTR